MHSLGVVFDGDHDFEGPRFPKAHLDTVNAIGNLSLTGGSTIYEFLPHPGVQHTANVSLLTHINRNTTEL